MRLVGTALRCGSANGPVKRERPNARAPLKIIGMCVQVCAVLYYLVCRCRQQQLEALCTVSPTGARVASDYAAPSMQCLESVPHRDMQLSTVGVASGLELRPVSTPLSREVRIRLRKSRRPQVPVPL